MRLLLCSAALALALAPQAKAVSFNFEEFDATRTGTQAATGGYSLLTSERDGLTMTLRRVQNKSTPGNYTAAQIFNFDVRSFTPAPSGWGSRSLDPTYNVASNPNDDNTWWLATFSQPVDFVSIEMTDFSPYVDTLSIRAFTGINASGIELEEQGTACFGTVAECPGRPAGSTGDTPDFAIVSLALEEGSFRSILFRASDRLNANGNLVDNINATPTGEIPEPAAFVLTGFSIGAAALSAALRKRS